MTSTHEPATAVGDAVLAGRAADGDDPTAFDELYRRHAAVATRVAQRIVHDADAAADVVATAFERVLAVVREQRLDDPSVFRSYLLVTTRNVALNHVRVANRTISVDPVDIDLRSLDPDPEASLLEGEDARLALRAFAQLPERWRSVLWLTEVDGASTAAAGRLLGLKPGAAAQLASRARSALRSKFLQEHLSEAAEAACRTTVAHLGAYVAGGLSPRSAALADQHLAGCERCERRRAELEDVGRTLRRAGLPLGLVVGLGRRAIDGIDLASASSLPEPVLAPAAEASLHAVPTGGGDRWSWAYDTPTVVRRAVGAAAAVVLGTGLAITLAPHQQDLPAGLGEGSDVVTLAPVTAAPPEPALISRSATSTTVATAPEASADLAEPAADDVPAATTPDDAPAATTPDAADRAPARRRPLLPEPRTNGLVAPSLDERVQLPEPTGLPEVPAAAPELPPDLPTSAIPDPPCEPPAPGGVAAGHGDAECGARDPGPACPTAPPPATPAPVVAPPPHVPSDVAACPTPCPPGDDEPEADDDGSTDGDDQEDDGDCSPRPAAPQPVVRLAHRLDVVLPRTTR